MRILNEILVHSLIHFTPSDSSKEPDLSSTTTPTCNPHTCRWKPYSNSNDFGANAAVVIIIIFSALVCVLSLNAAIRCFLHNGDSRTVAEQRKPDIEEADSVLVAIPTLVYSAGMMLSGAEPECAICLSEFEEGESIQVLEICNHGFHVHCIQQWLSSQTSCPTCRTSIFPSSSSLNIEEETAGRCMTPTSQQDSPVMEH